ncbi:MAG TPA: ribokinase [Actinomycetaceae bacterium]|nr:ribokinase [Actinomycetaceae bacterium]
MARVTVVGSINQDITVTADRFPEPGETLLGTEVSYRLGGKGANQAAAAARAGADAAFVGITGDDSSGAAVRAELSSYGVDVSSIATSSAAATGTAHITVNADGENTIIVVGGTNGIFAPGDLHHAAMRIAESDIIVLQCEIPVETNVVLMELCRELGVDVILNLAPAVDLPHEALAGVAVLAVNETEAALILGDEAPPATPDEALSVAARLRELGPSRVVITLGEQGAVYDDGDDAGHVPAGPVRTVVDTTGAGDAAVGVLAASLAEGSDFRTAVVDAMAAGAAACERPGAAASYPEFELTR